ncbi:MAG: butyrate kinase [Bacteroidota bacterium]|nr:butyrate kinase [Bacteroidota bacterium]
MISAKILIVYPAIESTYVAVYRSTDLIFLKNIKHPEEELAKYENLMDQADWRRDIIMNVLAENDINIDLIELVMGRSGLLKPVQSGVYQINERMLEDLYIGVQGVHATNLGGVIAFEIAKSLGKKAYMADPVVVDEMDEIAKVTGHPEFKRRSIFHALSHKHFARKYAKSINRPYEELNLIVCHVGTAGISIGAHKKGKVIDVNNSFDGDGPFGIQRSGTLPMGALVKLCFSGKYSEEEVYRMITKEGGYTAYLGTSNLDEIDKKVLSGNETTLFISNALSYQVSKEIGSMYTALECEVDAILLTGNIFNSERFLENVSQKVNKIAPIALYPSQNDFDAMALNGLRVIKNEVEVLEYK